MGSVAIVGNRGSIARAVQLPLAMPASPSERRGRRRRWRSQHLQLSMHFHIPRAS